MAAGNMSRSSVELDATSAESKLAMLGLSGLQASTYVCLLRSGPSSANQIAKRIHVNRTDVYRVIKVLANRGLVNMIMQNPNQYEASKPNMAVKVLISELEDRVKQAKEQVPEVIMLLDSIKPVQQFVEDRKERNANFRLLTGKIVITAWQALLKKADNEVMRVWSSEGIRTNYSQGFIDDFRECVNRGVRIRGIAEINKNNIFESEEFASLIELRHLDALSDVVRYEIVDRSEIIISAMDVKDTEKKLEGLQTNNKVLVAGFVNEFESAWEKAVPAKIRIDEIRKKAKIIREQN
ncbi:MAG: hypothetical protein JRN15_08880 [Nitrososphaerota archaeon]|nr:hypothetical protein [Nitrososphaerota archaeon]